MKRLTRKQPLYHPVYGDSNWLFNHLNTGLQTTLLRTTFTATLIAFFGCPVFCLLGSYYCYDNPAALEKNIELVSRFKLHSHFYHLSDAVRRTVKELGANRILPIVINFSWRKEAWSCQIGSLRRVNISLLCLVLLATSILVIKFRCGWEIIYHAEYTLQSTSWNNFLMSRSEQT